MASGMRRAQETAKGGEKGKAAPAEMAAKPAKAAKAGKPARTAPEKASARCAAKPAAQAPKGGAKAKAAAAKNVAVAAVAPDVKGRVSFSLPDQDGELFKSDDNLPLVLYFYPKDNTSACSIEAQEFSALLDEFARAGYHVAGVSRDKVASHRRFADKLGLKVRLLSDADEILCEKFGVIRNKMMFGKPARGVARSTFVIGENGEVAMQWRAVKAPGHAQAVLDALRNSPA